MNSDQTLSIDEILKRARKIAPNIAERAAQAERDRRVPRESIEELADSGLCRLYTPRRWGGYANGFSPALPAAIEIAKACTSTGWVFGFINFHAWIVAQYSEEAQAEVWAEGPDARVATSFAPVCKASVVDGGFRLTGKSPWASGIDHCSWIAAGALVEVEPGKIVHHMFLVPKRDFTVLDDWYNMGLRGSGSNSVVYDDIFIPAHRAITFKQMIDADGPGSATNDHPMFQTPFMVGVEGLICAPIVGAAMGAYDNYRDWTREKVTTYGGYNVAGSTEVQRRLSEAAGDIEGAYTVLEASFQRADKQQQWELLERARGQRTWSWIALTAQRGMDGLFQAGGAKILTDDNPIQRAWRDVHSISVHSVLNPYLGGINFARLDLGLGLEPHALV